MCTQNTLQQHILQITNGGITVADFLHATMQGQTHNAQVHHRMDAAKQLAKIALTTCEATAHPEPHPEPAKTHDHHDLKTDNCELTTENRPVTDLDIINHEAASIIREETNDGYHIAQFLARVMRGIDSYGNIISPSVRLAACKELLNRGFGRFGDSRPCRFSGSQDEEELMRSGLSRYFRDSAMHGKNTAYFLLDVASGQDRSFSIHQRVIAARELIRRGWDINYDAVTPEDIAAYHERQAAQEPTEYDIRARELEKAEQEAERKAERKAEEEAERAAQEPELEAGIFAHLTFAEVARYEAMSPQQKAEFVQQQRNCHANIRSP